MHMKTTKQNQARRKPLGLAVTAACGLVGLLAAGSAQAERWRTEGGADVDFSSTISYGLQVRASATAGDNIGNDNGGSVATSAAAGARLSVNQAALGALAGTTSNADFNFLNGDNGNLNYKKGDLVSSALKGTHELGIKWQDGWRFLGRATWIDDFAVAHTRQTPLSSDAKHLAEANVTLLDLWLSKEFKFIDNRPALVRFGNQVVSWGEDIFIPGGVNMINAIDLRKAHQPGTQLKEIFRPAPMLFASAGISDTVNLEGYYQFAWNGFQFDPVGTFFSAADVVGKGQLPAYIPSSSLGAATNNFGDRGNKIVPGTNIIPFGADKTPPNSGQYGLAARWKPSGLDTEYALYYIRYHDKLPFQTFSAGSSEGLAANAFGLTYYNEYGRNKDLFGFSLNTKIGSWAVGAELSYRPRESVAIDPTVPVSGAYSVWDPLTAGKTKSVSAGNVTTVKGYVEEEKWQGHLTGFYMFENDSLFGRISQALGASDGLILAEAAVTHFPKLDPSNIPYYVFPSYVVPDKTSAGFVVEVDLTYPNAFGSGITVLPQFVLARGVKGTSPNALPWVEGATSAFFGLNFDKGNIWRGQIGYSAFWGGGSSNPYRDRDFVGASVSYSF
jgi:hypothetical protein